MLHRINLFAMSIILFACTNDPDDISTADPSTNNFFSLVDSTNFRNGILVYSGDQGKRYWTEFNTSIRKTESNALVNTQMSLERKNTNAYLKCSFSASGKNDFSGIKMSVYKSEFDREPLPADIAAHLNGVSFNAMSFKSPMILIVDAVDLSGSVFDTFTFNLKPDTFETFNCKISNPKLKRVDFKVSRPDLSDVNELSAFAIDDVYLKDGSLQAFAPASDDKLFLQWIKNASLRFFDYNFKETSGDKGFVTESWTNQARVSLSGIGYAYAIFLITQKDGLTSSAEAKKRITAMLNWQYDQNWFDGSHGWHGFPRHYFNVNGATAQSDVSTIDWAICAAGLRVVRQFYHDDASIVSKVDELLSRPDWKTALDNDGKIVMGFYGDTGTVNDFRWGLSFSEETELVYLEAVASGDIPASVFNSITRTKKAGFYPSWFGAGFTYNWMQLWTGVHEPYKANSKKAFEADRSSCQSEFGRPLMGLTACRTLSDLDERGFWNWDSYISNQGSYAHGVANNAEVHQISPATYGAVLALPFNHDQALQSLREYASLGFYHPYLGLPDNIRLKQIPGQLSVSPNWDTFDINIGSQAMAIEQIQDNLIGKLYMRDPEILAAFDILVDSFTF